MSITDTVSKNMKLLRLLSDMTVRDAAKRLHISRQTLSRYEKGDISPDTAFLIALSRLLDIPFAAFVLGSDEQLKTIYSAYTNLSLMEKRFLWCYRNMSDFQKGYLYEVAAKGSETVEDETAGHSGRKSEEATPFGRDDT